MIRLDISWFPQIDEIMIEAFPKVERRTSKEQAALFNLPCYQVYGMVEEGILVAFLAVWEFDEIVFGEHLATRGWKRGTGIGKELLLEYRNTIKKPLFLEVEKPTTKIADRRIKFYERLGFYLYDHLPYEQPSFYHETPLPLNLMCNVEHLSDDTLKQYINILYTKVYKEKAPWK